MKEICLRIIRRCITVAESGDRSMEVEKMKNRTSVGVLTAALGLCLGIVSPAPAATKVWTSDDDWNTGVKSGVVVSAGSVVLELGSGSSNWYNSSWSKRAPITISNASGGDLTDYQVRVDVAYDGDMQSDFDDLRFTAGDGTTEIPYWIESKTDGSNAVVWVKVSSVPTAGATIYMYYGNASATDAGDGFAVFSLFDDFSGYTGDIDGQGGWTVEEAAGSSCATVNNGVLDVYRDGANNIIVTHSITTPSRFCYTVKVKPYNFNSNKRWFEWYAADYSTRVNFWFERIYYASAQRGVSGQGLSPRWFGTPTYGVWHINDVIVDTTGSTVTYKYYEDGNLITDSLVTKKEWTGSENKLRYVIEGYDGNGHCYFDYVYVRQYADPEPTTTIGSEESQ